MSVLNSARLSRQRAFEKVPNPTKDEITDRAREVRSNWSPEITRKRMVTKPTPVRFDVARVEKTSRGVQRIVMCLW